VTTETKPTCGECRWHYAHEEAAHRIGWKNCMAIEYPMCIDFYSTPGAKCIFPLKFVAHDKVAS
jgi:hypothetical protein